MDEQILCLYMYNLFETLVKILLKSIVDRTLWYAEVYITWLTLSQTSPGFYVSAVQVFWKHCEKRRNCL